MENVKGIIFDMDGTLIDSLYIWEVIWDTLGKDYSKPGFRPSCDDDKAIRTMLLSDACDMVHGKYGLGASGKELLKRMDEICIDFYANTVELKKGVRKFLDDCMKKGIKMCVATATSLDLISIAVKSCDLSKYFFDILSCAAFGKGKDCPDIYLCALEKLATPKEQTWVFEDSAVALTTASKMGLHTVGIYDDNNYGQDILKATANIYLDKGESFEKLI